MKRITVGFTFVTLIAIIFGCASDIILEEPESLKGVYKGRYIVTELSGDYSIERKQTIDWVFDDVNFHMDIDTLSLNWNRDFCVCNYGGPYISDEKVRLVVSSHLAPGYPGCVACDERLEPVGYFVLEQSTDTLKLSYLDEQNNYLKEILLIRVTE